MVSEKVMREIKKMAEGIRFGEITIVIKDGKVIDLVSKNRKRVG